MKIIEKNGLRLLLPAEGKLLTNGSTYSDGVYLAVNADGSEWHEVDWFDYTIISDDEEETIEAMTIGGNRENI